MPSGSPFQRILTLFRNRGFRVQGLVFRCFLELGILWEDYLGPASSNSLKPACQRMRCAVQDAWLLAKAFATPKAPSLEVCVQKPRLQSAVCVASRRSPGPNVIRALFLMVNPDMTAIGLERVEMTLRQFRQLTGLLAEHVVAEKWHR